MALQDHIDRLNADPHWTDQQRKAGEAFFRSLTPAQICIWDELEIKAAAGVFQRKPGGIIFKLFRMLCVILQFGDPLLSVDDRIYRWCIDPGHEVLNFLHRRFSF